MPGGRCGSRLPAIRSVGAAAAFIIGCRPSATASRLSLVVVSDGRSDGSTRSSCISNAVSGPACFGGVILPAATAYSRASVFSLSPNGECPSTAV
jgi:hypothetical protein